MKNQRDGLTTELNQGIRDILEEATLNTLHLVSKVQSLEYITKQEKFLIIRLLCQFQEHLPKWWILTEFRDKIILQP